MIETTIKKKETPMIRFVGKTSSSKWFGSKTALQFTERTLKDQLNKLDQQCYVVQKDNQVGMAASLGNTQPGDLESGALLAVLPPYLPEQLGDPAFREDYGLKYNYMAGAMANGISSEELVIAMGKNGFLASFGAGGLVPSRIESAIDKIQAALPNGPYAFNLIHSPNEVALERDATALFLRKGVKVIEASAFMDLTEHVVYYRAAGLSENLDGSVNIGHKIIAKVSRLEVGGKFMKPAPVAMLNQLVQENKITAKQADLATRIPMADDISVEADSGGHTDNRSLVCLLPSMIALRDSIQQEFQFAKQVRVGAGGGIGTPESVLAAYAMGAAYVLTGSINQSCLESGSSDYVRKVLSEAGMTDIMMAPASDMFELGVKLQVLKKGTLFGLRAQKLYDVYLKYNGIDEIPAKDRASLEKTIFKDSLENIWQGCISFFQERDPEQITRAQNNPKRKMALIFRWYLGLSSSWANGGKKGRELDYQIWCGPAMGAFNQWVSGSKYADWQNRKVAEVATELLKGAAYLYRIQYLEMQGLKLNSVLKKVEIV